MKFNCPKIPGTLNEIKRVCYNIRGNTMVRETVSGPDDRYEKQGLRMCDCCMVMTDRAVYMNQRGFCLAHQPRGFHHVQFEEGQWGFCVFCWTMFREREWKPLLARVLILNPQLVEWWVEELHQVLGECLYGEPQFAGDWTEEERLTI